MKRGSEEEMERIPESKIEKGKMNFTYFEFDAWIGGGRSAVHANCLAI